MTRTITGEITAWLTDSGNPDVLRGKPEDALNVMAFSIYDSMEQHGWTRVGKATITVDVVDEKQLVENKVASLRTMKATVMAEATATATEIERKIQNLLAISYDSEAK